MTEAAAAHAVRERPLMFKAEMVRALLADLPRYGRTDPKTQTRRTMKPQPRSNGRMIRGGLRCENDYLPPDAMLWQKGTVIGYDARCPYGTPGERIWVKETVSECEPCYLGNRPQPVVWYRADNNRPTWAERKWTPSILCPRRLSRIVLELTDVRAERLQDISEADAIAEGVQRIAETSEAAAGWACPLLNSGITMAVPTARQAYHGLWNSINGAGAWEANPYVWALTFRRVTPA